MTRCSDRDETDPSGSFCRQWGSTDVAADGLDRPDCGNCGTLDRADEWADASL